MTKNKCQVEMNNDLIKAAVNAQNIIHAIYQWLDKVEAAEGTTSIEVAHAMFKSLKNNRNRLDKLVTAPLEKCLAEMKGPTK